MGIIQHIDRIWETGEYRCNRFNTSFLTFATLHYNGVPFSNQITNKVWLGNYVESSNAKFMRENRIRVIVNCSKDLPFYFRAEEVPFQYRIPVDDDRQDNSLYVMFIYLPKIVDIIKFHVGRGENVYIHCHAGMQRSACVAAAYIMNVFKTDPDTAIAYIRKHRKVAFMPFVNFDKSLRNYYEQIKNN